MPLNIIETNLDKVKSELHALYVKDAKSGKYHLQLSDLKSYVEARVSPVENELKIAHENERKLLLENGLSAALRQANLDPHYEELIIANIGDRVALETVDNKRVVRIMDGKGEMPMRGSGADGVATLDDLVKEAVKRFPSTFKGTKPGEGGMPPPDAVTPGRSNMKTLTRSDFEALRPVERAAKMKEGFTIAEPPAEKPRSRRLGEKEILRSAFDALGGRERAAKMKEGFTLVD
jgi:hypothetical protein